MDLFFTKKMFLLLKTLTDVLEWCGLFFYQLFGLSF